MPRHKGVKEGKGQAAQSTGGGVIGSLGHKGGPGGQEVQSVVSGESWAQRIRLETLGPSRAQQAGSPFPAPPKKRSSTFIHVAVATHPQGLLLEGPPHPASPHTRTVVPGTAKARVCSDGGGSLCLGIVKYFMYHPGY